MGLDFQVLWERVRSRDQWSSDKARPRGQLLAGWRGQNPCRGGVIAARWVRALSVPELLSEKADLLGARRGPKGQLE